MQPPIKTFEIPASETDLNALADSINAVTQGTNDVISQMRSAVVDAITPIEQGYNALSTRISRAIGNTIRPVNSGINSVLDSVASNISGNMSEIAVQSAMVESMLPYRPTGPTVQNP